MSSLKVLFPRLSSISYNKQALVADQGVWDGVEWQWVFQCRRRLFEWEVDLEAQLRNIVNVIELERNREDKVRWEWSNNGKFSINNCSKNLMIEQLSNQNQRNFTCSLGIKMSP